MQGSSAAARRGSSFAAAELAESVRPAERLHRPGHFPTVFEAGSKNATFRTRPNTYAFFRIEQQADTCNRLRIHPGFAATNAARSLSKLLARLPATRPRDIE